MLGNSAQLKPFGKGRSMGFFSNRKILREVEKAAEKHFYFGDMVMITEGFFKDCIGKILDMKEPEAVYFASSTSRRPKGLRYEVQISGSDKRVWIEVENLKKPDEAQTQAR